MQGKRSIYVVDAEGKAAYREITANIRQGNDWVVESGLKAGETVIVEGTQKVRPGAPVKAVTAGAAADAKGDAKKATDANIVPPADNKGAAVKDGAKKSETPEPAKNDPYAAKGAK